MMLTIGILIAGALLVASLMEIAKHKLFGDESEKKTMVLLGLILSFAITPILYFGFDLMGEPLAMAFYGLSIYIVQKQMDMKAIRPILKKKMLDKLNEL